MRTNGSNGAQDVVQSTTRCCKAVGMTMRRNATHIARRVRAASISMTSRTPPLHRRVASRQPPPTVVDDEDEVVFLSSYQHLGTQSQRTYHDDGVAFPWISIKQCQ